MKTAYTRLQNVFEQPLAIRDRGLRAKFSDKVMKDGQLYKRVAEDIIPEFADALAHHMGRPITLEAMGWRLNYAGENPNKAIHSDAGWGKYAAVVCMDPNAPLGNGTAFWKHKLADTTAIVPEDVVTYFQVMGDWDNPDAFQQVDMAQAVFNEAVIYPTKLLHSRWPFAAYGSTPSTGRLTLVAFFS